MGITEEVARFVVDTRFDDVPEAVRSTALVHIVDTVGVMLAGSGEACARLARQVYGTEAGQAGVFGTPRRARAADAALANGVAGHALDYDDTQLSTSEEAVYGLLTHPSVPVLAAAAALAEELGRDGRSLLTAYVVGVEVACRVADAMAPRHYQDGFHSTGTVGTVGAAAAAAHVLRLDLDATERALGIAASMASGLRENFGTMTKPLHAGRAAQNGLLAARLAESGFTASREILEARRGFFRAAGGGFDEGKIRGRLGRPFFLESPGVSIKPYPSGSLSHPAQDLILDIVRQADLAPDDVARVEVGTNSNVPNALIHHRPTTGLEGKFSLEYCIATGVLRRRAGLAEFTDEAVRDPAVQAFLPKVTVVVDPRLEAMGYRHVRTRVTVVTRDGRVLEGERESARGYPGNPMSEEELAAKFRDCALTVLAPDEAEEAYRRLGGLAEAATVREVLATLVPGRSGT
jgi:2-methylcitrate dehydratase PrpD